MSNHKTLSILITALGGEGGGTLMNWILDCARKENFFVQGTSVPGVAQRTGSTSYYIEICNKNSNRCNIINAEGDQDVIFDKIKRILLEIIKGI